MRIVFLIPLTLYVLGLQGQCLEPGFSVPAASCIGQNITVTNETSLSDHTFAWDFCSGDLTSEPEATEGLMNSNFFRARSVKLVSENGMA